MNFVVIISDTLRRDHLPCYGNNVVVAPNIDKFAKESLIFEDSYEASFPTVPTRSDLMTGRYTFTYLDWGPLPQDEITLAQCLHKAGYLTAGVADTPFLVRNGYGHDRGFDDFISIRGQRSGPEHDDVVLSRRGEADYFAPKTFATAADWLERHQDEQFFLYIDTWDPHEPWDPPAHYVRPYLQDYKGEVIDPVYWDWEDYGTSERDLEIAHACYCGEISMVDRWFGYLMERLRTLGLMDDTVILFLSDHGFYFGEHGIFGKRRFRWADDLSFYGGYALGRTSEEGFIFRSPLHNEITRVPLLVHLPGVEPRRIKGLVSLPDLTPTILDLAGVEIPATVQAKSVMPLVRGDVDSLHEFVVTSAPFEQIGSATKTVDDLGRTTQELSPSSITDGEWDLLYAAEGEPVELFNRTSDDAHKDNVIDKQMDVAARLHRSFLAWLEELGTSEEILSARRSL